MENKMKNKIDKIIIGFGILYLISIISLIGFGIWAILKLLQYWSII
jgi:hypothetical protein